LRSELNAKAGLDSTRADEVATRIVEYRDKQRGGLIASFDEIKNLSGIEPQIGDKLSSNFFTGASAVKSAEAVSPQVGADLRNRAVYVTIVACIGMLAYIAFRFKSWGFGVGAIVAVFHDVLVTLGIFSIMQWEINLTVIAALLTLVGYSMNDTIVIFDRIRETMRSKRRESLEKLANDAINQTLSRTIITSGLTFLTVLAMLVFGGEVLKSFSWALFIGIIIGTYSSIYIASPFMIWWEKWRGSKNGAPTAAAVSISADTIKSGLAVGNTGVTPDMLAAAGVSVAPRKGSKRGQK
jgi:preprotein translocase subunit SecF